MSDLRNIAETKTWRQSLRRDMPGPERLLWYYLRERSPHGLKFRRQYGIGPYSIDFYCMQAGVAIEIDGDSHGSDEATTRDQARTDFLRANGVSVLRYSNVDVTGSAITVAEDIIERCKKLIAESKSGA